MIRLRALILHAVRNDAGDHARRFKLALHLWVAVGTLQKGRVPVTGEVGDRLFIHAAVEQGGHIQMPERVEMVLPAESVAVVELPQVLRERVGER